MKRIRKGMLARLLALCLALALSLAPVALALTPDELKTLLQEYYLDGVSDAVMRETTIEGIIKALGDPYTEYMSEAQYKALIGSMSDQEVGGIGITASEAPQGLLIVSIFEDSSAEALGLVAGDIITEVGGNAAAGQSAETITQWLRGEPGSTVSIKVLHKDGREATYTATRKLIVIPATTSELVEDRIGYINCKTFGEQTLTHFQEALRDYPEAKCWVVDLRTNLGGDVYAASQSLGTFLGKGSIAYLRNGKDQYVLYESEQDSATIQPTIVLTSSWTASAAEIFSGVIRDKQQGLVIGEKTFGKGVAQVLLDSDQYPSYFKAGDAMKITAFRYFTTSGSTADQIGIIPHLMVDAYNAGDIALLFTEDEPKVTDKSSFLRVHLGSWRWYIDLKKATTAEEIEYFTQLLEALPPNTVLKQGTAAGGWEDVTVENLAKSLSLSGYKSRSFPDVKTSQFGDEINTLATYGILKGQEGGVYSPDASLTRAELCALLVQALSLPNERKDSTFTDVAQSAWYADEVRAAQVAGLMKGVGGGKFDPSGTVTEEQLITVLARVGSKLNAYLYEASKTWTAAENQGTSRYSDWAQQSVWLLSQSQINVFGKPINLLYDDPSVINPKEKASREEAGALLYNVLTYIGILPAS